MAESRIQQEEAMAQPELSDTTLISQHTIGIDVPDPSVCQLANVEPAREEGDAAEEGRPGDVSIDSVETQNDEIRPVEAPSPSLVADESDTSVEVQSEGKRANTCDDNVDDTFDRVACRLSKVRRGDVRRRRLKWIAVGLLIATPLACVAAIGGMAIQQRPEDPFAWVKKQAYQFLGLPLENQEGRRGGGRSILKIVPQLPTEHF